MCKDEQKSGFAFEGRFLGFAAKSDAKLKYVRVATPAGEHLIKMPKHQRQLLYRQLTPGDWLQVSGDRKQKGWETQWKATVILRTAAGTAALPTSSDLAAIAPRPESPAPVPSGKPACILFCQKSDCCKKGAKEVAAALEAEIDDRGLNVTVKGTGCMKRCKAGPNFVMPDKTRYTQIRASEVPDLLDKHFPQPAPVPAEAIEPIPAVRDRVAVGV